MSREDYAPFKERERKRRERRAKRINSADDFGWSKHSDTHWYRMLVDSFGMSHKLHYWPSANKWLYKGQYYRGGLPKWIGEMVENDNNRLREKNGQGSAQNDKDATPV